jgi:hypothetical protein
MGYIVSDKMGITHPIQKVLETVLQEIFNQGEMLLCTGIRRLLNAANALRQI